MVADSSPLQESNAPNPMPFTVAGTLIDLSELHPLNAKFPMLVTVAGIVTLVRPSHCQNAPSEIALRPLGSGAVLSAEQFANTLAP